MQSDRHFSIKGEPWQLWVDNKKLTSNLSSTIYSAVHTPDSLAYWQTKPDVTPEVMQIVDWPAIGRSMKGRSTSLPNQINSWVFCLMI
jgi:hypothetical protein